MLPSDDVLEKESFRFLADWSQSVGEVDNKLDNFLLAENRSCRNCLTLVLSLSVFTSWPDLSSVKVSYDLLDETECVDGELKIKRLHYF